MTDNSVFATSEGLLSASLASRKVNDIVHINLSGIIKLGLIFRENVLPNRVRFFNSVDPKSTVEPKESPNIHGDNERETQPATTEETSPSDKIQGDGASFSAPGEVPPRS